MPFKSDIASLEDFVNNLQVDMQNIGKLPGVIETEPGNNVLESPRPYIADGFANAMRANDPQILKNIKSKLKKSLDFKHDSFYENMNVDFKKYMESEITLQSLIDNSSTFMATLSNDTYFIEIAEFKEVLKKFADFTMADNAPTTGIYTIKELNAEDLNYLQMYTLTLFNVLNQVYDKEVKKATTDEAIQRQQTQLEVQEIINGFSGDTSSYREFVQTTQISLREYLNNPVSNFYTEEGTTAEINKLSSDIRRLYEPIFIAKSENNKKAYIEYREKYLLYYTNTTGKIQTIGDLKQLEKLGLYNPNRDLVSKYGLLPAGTITNLYVTNGKESLNFGKVMFNRFIAEAHQFRISCIGRPEFMLNRPYFTELKKAIGLSKSHSISWAFNSDFMSTVELTFIRNNKLTYKYAKDNIDEIAVPAAPSIYGTNLDFYNQAKEYYSSMKTMQGLKDLTNKTQQTVSSGSYTPADFSAGGLVALAAGAVVEVGASIATAGIEDFFPTGGIYVAHDYIGHIDFDQTGKASSPTGVASGTNNVGGDYLIQPTTQEMSGSPLIEAKLGNFIITEGEAQIIASYLLTLQQQLTILSNIEELYQQKYNDIKSNDELINKQTEKVDKLKEDVSKADPPDLALTRQLISETNLLNAMNEAKPIDVNALNIIIKQHNDKAFEIYGVYTVEYDPEANKRSGNTWSNTVKSGHMLNLYNQIPLNSVDGKRIEGSYTIVDDVNATDFVMIGSKKYINFIKFNELPVPSFAFEIGSLTA
jgi:hypothetical protein